MASSKSVSSSLKAVLKKHRQKFSVALVMVGVVLINYSHQLSSTLLAVLGISVMVFGVGTLLGAPISLTPIADTIKRDLDDLNWKEAKACAHKRYEKNPHLPKVHLGNYHEARPGEGYLIQGEPKWLFAQMTLECLRRYAAQVAPYCDRDFTFDQVYTDLWACREVLKMRYNSIHRAARQDLRGRSSYRVDQARDLYEAMHFFARRQNRYDELIAKAEADYDELDDPYGKDYSWLARSDRLRDAQHRELVDACVKVATHQGSMWT